MSPDIRIALLGFTAFERAHIEAALQPNDEPGPRYLAGNDLMACSLAVVNADDEPAVQRVTQHDRLASTLMLGTTPRPGAAAQLGRPIKLVQLLRALHTLSQQAPPMSAAVKRVHEDLVRLRQRQTLPAVSRPMQPAVRPLDHVPLIEGPTVVGGPRPLSVASPVQHVLVVDDEEHSLRHLATELPAWGIEVHRVCNGAQAPDLLAQGQGVERLRAQMAGADACLDKPPDPADLRDMLAARPARPPADAQTTRATSPLL